MRDGKKVNTVSSLVKKNKQLFSIPSSLSLSLFPQTSRTSPLFTKSLSEFRSMSDYLPEEVLSDIFRRLPVKIILQLCYVCKQWRSVISNPNFHATHVAKTDHNEHLIIRHFIQKERCRKEYFLLVNNHETLDVMSGSVKFEFPFITRSKQNVRVVGCLNGVLCLSDDLGAVAYGIILWNPFLRRFVNLPAPRVTRQTHGSYTLVLGFGFDRKSNDYKVVRIAYVKGRNGYELIPPEVEVFSLRSRSWRSFDSGAPPYGIHFGHTGLSAFVNGHLHWIGYDPCKKGKKDCLIVSFDMNSEVFREILLPDCLSQSGWDLSVYHYGESLSVLQYEQHKKEKYLSVWIMNDYVAVDSWTKVYTIEMCGGLDRVIGFRENGDVLIATVRGKLISYDLKTRQKYKFGICGAIDSFYIKNYQKSLVLLEYGNAIKEGESITIEGGEDDEDSLQWPRFGVQNVEQHQDWGLGESCSEDEYGWGSTKTKEDEWNS